MAPRHRPWIEGSFLVCISAVSSTGNRWTWFFNHESATKSNRQCIEELQAVIDQHDRLIAHNLKFDLQWLWHIGIDTSKKLLWCTLVAEYVLRCQQKLQGLSLEALSEYYGIPPKKDKVKVYWDAGVDTDEIPSRTLQVYCEQDCYNALAICSKQLPQANKRQVIPLLSIEMESTAIFSDMEMNGMYINVEYAEQLDQDTSVEIEQYEAGLMELLGIDAITPQKLSAGLYGGEIKYDYDEIVRDAEGNPVLYKTGGRAGTTKTRKSVGTRHIRGLGFDPKRFGIPEMAVPGVYSTSKAFLPMLKSSNAEQRRALTLIDEHSKLSKLRDGYYASLPRLSIDGTVHPNLNQTLTKTGRMSCAKPNLQNVPRGNTGPVKKLFISRYSGG